MSPWWEASGDWDMPKVWQTEGNYIESGEIRASREGLQWLWSSMLTYKIDARSWEFPVISGQTLGLLPGSPLNKLCAILQWLIQICQSSTGNTSSRSDMENERSLTGKDVVSKLFQNEPTPKDDLGELYHLHRQAFQTSEYEKLQISAADSSSTKSNVTIEDADTLLDIFRNCQHYFPFVSISEPASAASMSLDRPFLLMAILNVCSSRVPSLQQKTDERFRRVMSERIVFHDEKSLDYLQGLLVYIAW